MHRLPTFTHRCATCFTHSNIQPFLIPGTTRKREFGLSSWTSINFRHPHHKTGNLLLWKQNGLVGVTTQGDLVGAPAYPFHSVLPFQDILTALVFLQRGFLTLRQQHHAIICWLSWLMYSPVIFLPQPEGFLGRMRNPPLCLKRLIKELNNTNITKKFEISKYLWKYFVFFSSGSGIRTSRPPGYEPDELPLLYPAMFSYDRRTRTSIPYWATFMKNTFLFRFLGLFSFASSAGIPFPFIS